MMFLLLIMPTTKTSAQELLENVLEYRQVTMSLTMVPSEDGEIKRDDDTSPEHEPKEKTGIPDSKDDKPSQQVLKQSSRLYRLRSKKKLSRHHSSLPDWFLQSTTVTFENDHLVTVNNIRNLSYHQWMNLESLSEPTNSCLISRKYDIERLKEIWVGFSPSHCWITFCFFPAESVGSPSENYQKVDEFYKKIDSFDYLSLSIEHRSEKGKILDSTRPFHRKSQCLYVLCTEYDILNMMRAQSDYPFPIQIYPILEPAETTEEKEKRKVRAQSLLRRAFELTNHTTASFKRHNLSVMDLGKEFGLDNISWVKALVKFNSSQSNTIQRILWDAGLIRTDIRSLDAAAVTFNVLPILSAHGVLDLSADELPRVLHANLRDNQRK